MADMKMGPYFYIIMIKWRSFLSTAPLSIMATSQID